MSADTRELALEIEAQADHLRSLVKTSDAQWSQMLRRLRDIESVIIGGVLVDEQVWTFLTAVGYAANGPSGIEALNGLLVGGRISVGATPVWFEALPIPPRTRESNTHLDLAAGTIRSRSRTEGGVELDPTSDSWVCFVEAKWYSDLSYKVTNHPERNQLARVIENALAFQAEVQLATSVHITLMTPERFRLRPTPARLYGYKYEEYKRDPSLLLGEFDVVNDALPQRHAADWTYPSMSERLDVLHLNWVTFEELIAGVPESTIGHMIREFGTRFGDPFP